ncbi:MAG: response regulator transcription factor [Caldilineaceae bacterium]|nr:response regulator transcription factor [Caldilineaceae bacterium]
MTRTILVADDEQNILETLSAYLRQDGFNVVTARTGREALFHFRDVTPDLVLLDVMMPEMDGWAVARAIRKESGVPLMFLTARIDDIDQVAGLEIGADEYITKPFSPRVVVAKVRALLRRAYGELAAEPELWRVRDLELNGETHTVTLRGQPVELTPNEFGLLGILMARPGRVFTRMELLDQLEGEAYAAYERTIDVHVKNLRKKIETDPRDPDYIETVYGVGYRMRPDHE